MRWRRRNRAEPEVQRSDAEWREVLDPEAYRVLRKAGTERPGSSPYAKPPSLDAGVYRCAGCQAELFLIGDQFDSGTGWPSFSRPTDETAVELTTDFTLIVPRREATCARCGGHLSHVFNDGPAPSGQRWCINGAALSLDERNGG